VEYTLPQPGHAHASHRGILTHCELGSKIANMSSSFSSATTAVAPAFLSASASASASPVADAAGGVASKPTGGAKRPEGGPAAASPATDRRGDRGEGDEGVGQSANGSAPLDAYGGDE